LLLSSGGPEDGNPDLVIRPFYALLDFLKARPVGHLHYPFFRSIKDLTPVDEERARQFARKFNAPA